MEPKCLTTKQVARLCRVSDATVKRWEDAGLITSERTTGGHRRFRAEEIARFQKDKQLGIRRKPGDESVVTAPLRRKADELLSKSDLFHSMIAGREEEVAEILIARFLGGSPLPEIFDEAVSPTMTEIGELWFKGEVSVTQEHLATRSVMCALHKLRNVVPVTEACDKVAMCFGAEGDLHELPTHLIQMTFEIEGWNVVNFGANTPMFAIIGEIEHYGPEFLCISCTVMNDVERLADDYSRLRKEIQRLNIPVLLGGRAFENKLVRDRFPADYYPDCFADAREIAKKHAC